MVPTYLPPFGSCHITDGYQAFLSLPTPILKSARNSLDAVGSPSSHTSDTSSFQPPPSPTLSAHSTGSIRFATSKVLRDNNPEEHDGMSSLKLLAPPPPHHRRKGSVTTVSSVGSSSTEREYEDNQSFRLSPVRSAHSDANSTLPSPTYTHVDVVPDVPSRSSSQPVLFERHYIASSGLSLPAAKRTLPQRQRQMMGRRGIIQTSSAKDLNSHALLCWISNKKRIWMSIRSRSNRFSSSVLLARRAWRPSRAWQRRCGTPRSWDTTYLRSEHQAHRKEFLEDYTLGIVATYPRRALR